MFTNELLKRFQELPTPFYYYDTALFQKTLDTCNNASLPHGFHVHYALKANVNDPLLTLIKNAGLGADCVSGGEVQKAIAVGFDKKKVVFAGVGKSDKEIRQALEQDIFCFNVESVQELQVIDEIAASMDKVATIALRINPNVDANTHHYITTGLEENKFGINSWEFDTIVELFRTLKNIRFIGLHFHVGSQVTDLTVFKNLCVKVNEFQQWFNDRNLAVKVLNVGGGLGVDYHHPDKNPLADFDGFFDVYAKFLNVEPRQEVHFELGRAIIAQCGSLISRVLYVKEGQNTNFAVLDAGMTELIRPALYHAYHKVENISKQLSSSTNKTLQYDVVGPICESSDCFGKNMELPLTHRGDIMAIRTAGAYGEVMSSDYNLRDKLPPAYSTEMQ